MKFWQRFLVLGVICFLVGTVYYYNFLDDAVTVKLREQRRALESRLVASPSLQLNGSFSVKLKLDPAVCSMRQTTGRAGEFRSRKRIGRKTGSYSVANLSTVDLYHETNFKLRSNGMYELPSAPPEYSSTHDTGGHPPAETLRVIVMPHSHVDPGWLKTTTEYYDDQTKHILTNMVNKLTEHPDLTFVWAETIFFDMWWKEQEDAVKVRVRRLIRRGQLEVALGGWVMPDEASSHYVSVIDQLVEGHQWLWENLGVKPQNSWSIDPFGYSGALPYLWKLSGMDNMVIQRVHQAVKASLMSRHSLEFQWRQFWDQQGLTDILCHVMPYMLYSIKFSCGPDPSVCVLYDFRDVRDDWMMTGVLSIVDENVEIFAQKLYKQFRQKAYFYRFNTILVPVGDDFRFDREVEWEQQYGNYSRLMRYMNSRSEWNVHVRFGTLQDYFGLARQQQLAKHHITSSISRLSSGGGVRKEGLLDAMEFPVLSGDFFPYSDRNLRYWTGYYTTRPFDKRFQREVQGMIQAADIAVTLTYAIHKRQGSNEVKDKFSHLASMMQLAHRNQGHFLHHDAITGTSRNHVVKEYEAGLLAAYSAAQSVTRMALQDLVTRGKVQTPYVFHPETVRHHHDQPPEKVTLSVPEEGMLHVLVYNPLPQYRQQPVTLLVDTNQFLIRNHRREIIPCQINPVWGGKDRVRLDRFEVVFVADLPPLATLPFMFLNESILPKTTNPAKLSIFNSPTLAVPPELFFPREQPQPEPVEPVSIHNDKLRIRVDPQTGKLMDVEDVVTGNITVLDMGLEVYRSQGSGAYLFRPESGSEPLITTAPTVRVVEGPLMSVITVVHPPYITQSFTLYHHPALLASGIHIRNDLDIRTLKNREVIMRMKTDLRLKTPAFFSDQNGMQYILRRTNDNVALEANYYPMTSGAFLDDSWRRVSLLSAQPHGVASLKTGWLEVMLDRYPLNDDDCGLAHGVQDVKPVTSEFVLLVESRSAPQPNTDRTTAAHHAFSSLLGMALGDCLQHPAAVYFSSEGSDIVFSSAQLLNLALDCDLALLSLRSLATSKLNYNGTSLILHRRAYDCDFPAYQNVLQCAVTEVKPTFEELFGDLGLSSVRETSLTHLHHKRFVALKDRPELRPMDIASYHLIF